MGLKIQATAPRLDQVIQSLENYPETADKYHRVALRAALNEISGMVEPGIPVDTGKAKEAFGMRVAMETMSTAQDKSFGAENITGFGSSFLVGRVGWWGKTPAWYIRIVESGAGEHPIEARRAKTLTFNGEDFHRSVQHPGFAPANFFRRHESQAREAATSRMQEAGQRILAALTKGAGA